MIAALFLANQQINAQTTSPFSPPEEKLGTYVINSGAGLDTGCTFRRGGPLIINLEVPATMNPKELNGDGFLKDPQKLIDNKVIGSRAKISFPVFDIDDKANVSGISPEIDKIYFNGEFIKNLSGFDNQWTNDSFSVDISKIKFNTTNEIRIEIDTANTTESWCMAVDWVSIEFDASIPYVLAHGISADASTWENNNAPNVLATMDNSGVLYSRFSTGANGSVAANARDLKIQIKSFLDSVKSDKVHIIAHSKGGLDSQALAKLSPPDFKVLSLSTLSTPHRGSAVADLQLIQRQAVDRYINQGNDPNGFAQQFASLSLAGWANRNFNSAGPQPPGLNDLTTQAAATAINARTRGNIPNTYTIGSDAGPQCTRNPTDLEIDPLANSAPFGTMNYTENALRLSYQVICNISSAVNLETRRVLSLNGKYVHYTTILTYSTVQSQTLQPNDIVVGINSANPGWGISLGNNTNNNHTEVKSGNNVKMFLDRTIKLR